MKKTLLSLFLLAAAPCLASSPGPSTDLCSQLSGVWEGRYQDPTGLFVKKAFPIKIALQKNGSDTFYGYTMKSLDSKGAGFGKQAWLIWGTCSNNTISSVYFINPNNKPVCGDAAQTNSQLTQSSSMMLYIPWENAMTGTTFHANLKKIAKKFEVNVGLIDAAKELSTTKIHTCH